MFFIILLVFFGLLFLVAELVLLPGVSIGAILALVSYGGAIYIAFRDYGPLAGGIVVAVVLILSFAATVVSLRSKTWRRFSLKQKVDSSVMPEPVQQSVRVGDLRSQVHGQLYRSPPGGRSRRIRKFQYNRTQTH